MEKVPNSETGLVRMTDEKMDLYHISKNNFGSVMEKQLAK